MPQPSRPATPRDHPVADLGAGAPGAPAISLIEGLRAVNLKLYDERQRRMVTFAQARVGGRPRSASPAARAVEHA